MLVVTSTFPSFPLERSFRTLLGQLSDSTEVRFSDHDNIAAELHEKTGLTAGNLSGVNVFLLRVEDIYAQTQSEPGYLRTVNQTCKAIEQQAKNSPTTSFIVVICLDNPLLIDSEIEADREAIYEIYEDFQEILLEKVKNSLSNKQNIHILATEIIQKNIQLDGKALIKKNGISVLPQKYFDVLGVLLMRQIYNECPKLLSRLDELVMKDEETIDHEKLRQLVVQTEYAPSIRPYVRRRLKNNPKLRKGLEQSIDKLKEGDDSYKPLFLIHPVGMNTLCYRFLIKHIAAHPSCYGFSYPDINEMPIIAQNMEELAALYLITIRNIQPKGPYAFAGHSFGGMLAVEIADQLMQAGETVEFLGILDTWIVSCFDANARDPLKNDTKDRLTKLFTPLFSFQPEFKTKLFHLLECGFAYTPPQYSGPITLFKAKQLTGEIAKYAPNDHPTNFWDRFSTGDLTIHPVPGDHDTMLSEENVKQWVGTFQESLTRADRNIEQEFIDTRTHFVPCEQSIFMQASTDSKEIESEATTEQRPSSYSPTKK